MEKTRIGGIKKSLELTLLTVKGLRETQPLLSHFCGMLAKNRINMAMFTLGRAKGEARISCCVSTMDGHRALELLETDRQLRDKVRIVSGVGLLSIYPARSSLTILGRCVTAFGRVGAPIYGIGSSLSTYTFITDHYLLDRAIDALNEFFELPPDHAPVEQEIKVLQSRVVKEE
jgi:aspartokinase